MNLFSDQEYEHLPKYQKAVAKTEFPEKLPNFQI